MQLVKGAHLGQILLKSNILLAASRVINMCRVLQSIDVENGLCNIVLYRASYCLYYFSDMYSLLCTVMCVVPYTYRCTESTVSFTNSYVVPYHKTSRFKVNGWNMRHLIQTVQFNIGFRHAMVILNAKCNLINR